MRTMRFNEDGAEATIRLLQAGETCMEAVLFMGGPEQVTIPRKMWSGIREQISPAILAAATLLIGVAIVLLISVEWLRRRGERLGTQP